MFRVLVAQILVPNHISIGNRLQEGRDSWKEVKTTEKSEKSLKKAIIYAEPPLPGTWSHLLMGYGFKTYLLHSSMQSMASTLSLFAPTILNHGVLKTSEFSEVFKLFPKIRILDKNNPSIQKMARGTSEMVSRVDSAIDHGILRATRDLDIQLDNFSEDTSFLYV